MIATLTLLSISVNYRAVFIVTLLLLCIGAIKDSKKK